ncbi:TIGR04255 family protein [Streptomyces microflavus]|uniref:TIGR04255 family protein n=1 Tax=Streptomyces microflavus TaxID=1919 RepID=UPI0037A73CFB
MSEREYPNAPVVLVAVEIRHPVADPLRKSDQADLKRHLATWCPLSMPARNLTMTATAAGVQQEEQIWPRFVSRDKTTAVTYRHNAISVETLRYRNYEAVRALTRAAIEGRQQISPVDGVERIGMRYINEVRVPELRPPQQWSEWVSSSLTGPATIAPPEGLALSSWQGATVFGDPARSGAMVRHGAFEGYAVDPGGELNRTTPPPGPFFLIDIDAYWNPADQTPDLKPDSTIEQLDELNATVKGLFEGLITDRLRDEVLRYER